MGSGGNAATLSATADWGWQMGYRGSSLRLAGCQVVALQTDRENDCPHEAASNITVAEFLTRLHTAVPPKRETRSTITSLQLPKLGQELMEEVGPKLGEAVRKQIDFARERAAADRVEATTGTIGRRHRRSAGEHCSTGEHRSSRDGKHVG
jgi:hypothetical protein